MSDDERSRLLHALEEQQRQAAKFRIVTTDNTNWQPAPDPDNPGAYIWTPQQQQRPWINPQPAPFPQSPPLSPFPQPQPFPQPPQITQQAKCVRLRTQEDGTMVIEILGEEDEVLQRFQVREEDIEF